MIQDNTTKWKVRKFTDFASNDALPVGFIYQHISSVVPVGSLPLFGAEYDRTLYADLWSWANENGLVVTEEEWQASASAQGGSCAKFSEGNGTTTFRVPALKCWIKGANGVEEVGGYLEAGLPDITGVAYGSNINTAGAFLNEKEGAFFSKPGALAATIPQFSATTSDPDAVLGFKASLANSIYSKSDTVQPPSIIAMYCIKAFGTVSNVGNADVGNVMSAVEQVQTAISERNIKTYTSLEQLGLDKATITIEQICETLPKGSVLLFEAILTECPNLEFPRSDSDGQLIAVSNGKQRVSLEFTITAGEYHEVFTANYANWANTKFSGWRKLATNDALSMPSDNNLNIALSGDPTNYYPPADGWVCVTVGNATSDGYLMVAVADKTESYHIMTVYNNISIGEQFASVVAPCRKDTRVDILWSSCSVISAVFVYAQSEV